MAPDEETNDVMILKMEWGKSEQLCKPPAKDR